MRCSEPSEKDSLLPGAWTWNTYAKDNFPTISRVHVHFPSSISNAKLKESQVKTNILNDANHLKHSIPSWELITSKSQTHFNVCAALRSRSHAIFMQSLEVCCVNRYCSLGPGYMQMQRTCLPAWWHSQWSHTHDTHKLIPHVMCGALLVFTFISSSSSSTPSSWCSSGDDVVSCHRR